MKVVLHCANDSPTPYITCAIATVFSEPRKRGYFISARVHVPCRTTRQHSIVPLVGLPARDQGSIGASPIIYAVDSLER
jgi:hypothetical protein